jgi:uncharacterized protein (DUF1015 family)
MIRVRPFAAVRPLPNLASRVAAPPYDVVSREEARQFADGNPLCFLRVCRPEIDLPDSVNPYDESVYQRGRANLHAFIDQGTLIREPQPRLYLYRLVMNHRSQIGLVGCFHIDDYERGLIKKHEKTRKDKEDDRTRHILTLGAQAGPVFLTYRDQRAIDEMVHRDINHRPLMHFNSSDGVTHTVWNISDPQAYVNEFARLDFAYVADGHHRSASALRAGLECRKKNPSHRGDEAYNWFLAVIFPASQLLIMPYNRLVLDLAGLSSAQVLERLGKLGSIAPTTDPVPDRAGTACFYLDRRWHKLRFDEARIPRADPIASLDVSLVQDHVLGPLFGIHDPRTDKRIDFVGGIRGTKELEERVNRCEAKLAISMFATTIDQLLNVADAGAIMPPKSTWFEPKLKSGLFVHMIDEEPMR